MTRHTLILALAVLLALVGCAGRASRERPPAASASLDLPPQPSWLATRYTYVEDNRTPFIFHLTLPALRNPDVGLADSQTGEVLPVLDVNALLPLRAVDIADEAAALDYLCFCATHFAGRDFPWIPILVSDDPDPQWAGGLAAAMPGSASVLGIDAPRCRPTAHGYEITFFAVTRDVDPTTLHKLIAVVSRDGHIAWESLSQHPLEHPEWIQSPHRGL